MKLLSPFDEFGTTIKWAQKARAIANDAIEKFNRWQLGDNVTAREAYIAFGMAYSKLQDVEGIDYSREFNLIRDELDDAGFDVSFYNGFH